MPYDVIGNVRGEFDKLVELLKHLGYQETAGAYRHPDRTAIFVGDLIDRGPKQLATGDIGYDDFITCGEPHKKCPGKSLLEVFWNLGGIQVVMR